MSRHKAINIWTTYYLAALIGLATFFITSDARADNQIRQLRYTATHSDSTNNRSNVKYSEDLSSLRAADEDIAGAPENANPPCRDILPFVKLALKEFDLLPRVRHYLNLTEKHIEKVSTKLWLKGDISLRETALPASNSGSQAWQPRTIGKPSSKSADGTRAASLFMPDRLKWNLGLNPNSGTFLGRLGLNSYLDINSEFGDANRVSLFFKYTF